MMGKQESRVVDHPVLGWLEAGEEIIFFFDDQAVTARNGDVVASALLAAGIRTLGETRREVWARGLYCAIGHCFECQVTINGERGVRACLTPVQSGMRVESKGFRSRNGHVHDR